MSYEHDPANPYVSPEASPFAAPVEPYPPVYGGQGPSVPVFCIVVFILDTFFLVIRVPMVLLGIVAVTQMAHDPVIARTGMFEVTAGAAMVLAGIPANIAMLLRQRWALVLACVCVAATLGSLGVAAFQMSIALEQFEPGSPEWVGGMIGAGLVAMIRVGLLMLYVAALLKFARAVR